MNLYGRPVLFAIAAAVVISVGTLATTFIPLFMPSTQPVSRYVKPYTAIELEGRDIYIREGCNNCHTQTVRPLRTEVARYGEYSKPEEFAYDRPFLWGSRRTGPDLARVGGKYPDAWHYQHMVYPQGMFAKSNMPAYRWLAEKKLSTDYTAKKVAVLGYGYAPDEVARQIDAVRRQVADPAFAASKQRALATPDALRAEITELDALVAYLQKLGRDVKELERRNLAGVATAEAAVMRNPYSGDRTAVEEGEGIYAQVCRSCHGEKAKGGIGPDLTAVKKKFGGTDADLFASIAQGRPGGMPAWDAALGKDKIWKVIAYLRSLEKR